MGRRDRFGGRFDEVLAAAQRNERWALEHIYRVLGGVVTGYLRSQGAVEPEDLTSEVFVAVLRNLGRFRGDEAGFRAWVFTIAHRRLLDERRWQARHPAVALDGDREAHLPAADDVAEAALASLAVARVRDLCGRLAPDQRDVLLLRLVGRFTVDEVADLLGKSPGAVKALQRRGFRAVARLLEGEGVPL
jgi:RNA polymerase sigma factor (sigma-70 family)